MLLNKFLIILATVILTACTTTPTVIGTNSPIILPDYVYEVCAPLNKLPDNASFEVLLESYINNISVYTDCKNKQNYSIELIKKLTSKKE
jgi:hypothetical protein